jgi:hypothetical protein
VRTWKAAVAGLLGAAIPVAIVSGSLTANAAPNPPGNNGTIKIDGLAFDDAPDNEPHVGCVFQLDFYGYDQGDLVADVTFSAHPPTLPAGQDRVLLTDTVAIGEDDNSGGGSQAGLDASVDYRLDLTGIAPHPKQGVHVTLTINADGSQGADVKHKVFWVTGCEGPSPSESPTPTPSDSPSETPSETPSEGPSPSETSSPTDSPTDSPSPSETTSPTDAPSVTEEPSPSEVPSETESPTEVPTESPTNS